MTRKKHVKKKTVQVSPEAQAKANVRVRKRWRSSAAKTGRTGTPPETVEKVFSKEADLPRQDKKADAARTAAERSKAAAERRKASSTTPGKGKPAARGKSRGTGGRMTRGS